MVGNEEKALCHVAHLNEHVRLDCGVLYAQVTPAIRIRCPPLTWQLQRASNKASGQKDQPECEAIFARFPTDI